MARRIDIELTSARDDGTWTWRAAGAREPKGVVPADVVGPEAKVGDVLKVDAEFYLDGIQVVAVVNTTRNRREAERIEILGSGRGDEPLVTTTLARGDRDRGDRSRRDRPRRPQGERGDRGDGDRRQGQGREGERRPRREGDRGAGRSRPARPEAPPIPVIERPKAKRLRAGRAHRNALLASLPEEQRPIAEQVVLGGLPAVRQAIEKQNAERAAAGEPAIQPGPLLELAEKLVPKVRAAEWRDRAEAAKDDLEVLDLRDLRSVVSAGEGAARDEESRELARILREGLAARVDAEHATWLQELNANLDVGRIVRALRLSSRPPKAGAPLPPEVATRLTEQASAALTADAAAERWVAVLDALAFSPVRDKVIPASLPTDLHADVRATIARLATRLPKLAHIFEIAPDPTAPRPERRRPNKPKKAAPKPPADPTDPANRGAKIAVPVDEHTPVADGEPTPAADGEPTPAAGGDAEPANPGAKIAVPVDEHTPVADGEPTPAADGEPTPAAVEADAAPAAEADAAPAAEESAAEAATPEG